MRIQPALLQYQVAATIADTVAGLGSGQNGEIGAVRTGSSPYDYVFLVYDASLGKWVSEAFLGPTSVAASFTTTSVSYAAASDANVSRIYILGYQAIYNAGLRLQVRNSAQINAASGGVQATGAVALFEFNDGDTTVTQIGSAVGSEVFVVGTTATYDVDPWEDFDPGSPTEAHAVLIFMVKVASGTGTFGGVQNLFRFVAASA